MKSRLQSSNPMPYVSRHYRGSGQIAEDDSLVMTRFGGGFLDEYIHGARRSVPGICAFSTPDALCEKRPWESPYLFCAANPVNTIDYDGNLVIFINGFHTGDGGKSDYWEGVDKMVLSALNENDALYYDGSSGGIYNTWLSASISVMCPGIGMNVTNLLPGPRYNMGYIRGLMEAKKIMKIIKNSDEKVYFITHSMGAIFAKGFISGLIYMAEKMDADIREHIGFEIDYAPFQPTSQKVVDDVITYVIQNIHDPIAGEQKMKGATQHFSTGEFGHSIVHLNQDSIEEIKEDMKRKRKEDEESR